MAAARYEILPVLPYLPDSMKGTLVLNADPAAVSSSFSRQSKFPESPQEEFRITHKS